MANRGYAGYYKSIYLRSSYEYAYAVYLDFYGINWKYEIKTFDIGYKFYKPDFFILNPDSSIKKIVEIKSKNLQAIEDAKRSIEIIHKQFGYEVEVVSYKELLKLYKTLPFSLTSTIDGWINSDKTTINKAAYGKENGHYNMKHSEATKKKIGEHTKKLWETDSPSKKRMVEGLNKSGMKKGYIKVPRQKRKCQQCKVDFQVLSTSPQKYCSQKCSAVINIKLATEASIKKQFLVHEEIKKRVIEWAKENKSILKETPYNQIKPTIAPLISEIELRFEIKDLRVISKAVFGKDCGRKALLRFMKNV